MVMQTSMREYRKRVHIPLWPGPGFAVTPAHNATGTAQVAAGGFFPGAATGSATLLLKEISTFGIAAPLMTTAGQEVCFRMTLPEDVNPDFYLGFYVKYSTGSTDTADTITWKVFVDLKVGESTGALVKASTALDTVIAQDTVHGTAYATQTTAEGKKNAGFATRANLASINGVQLCGLLEMDAKAGGLTEDIFPLEVVMTYVPVGVDGRGIGFDPGLPTA